MADLPSLDLIRSVHQFPGPFLFKVVGFARDNFVARVLVAVREELLMDADPPFSLRTTASGRHVAISLEPVLNDAEQVHGVYRRLRAVVGIVMIC